MKEFVDLRPDKALIDTEFSGYKLSLDSVPIYDKQLESGKSNLTLLIWLSYKMCKEHNAGKENDFVLLSIYGT